MRPFGALLAAGVLTVTSAAQDQTQVRPPVFRAGVDVVQLEVSVLDNDRRPVRGLTTGDFAVFEDGKSEPVVDVQEFALDDGALEPVWAKAAAIDVATNDVANRRLVAIVMDDLNCCYAMTPLADGRRLSDPWAIGNATATAGRLVDSLGPKDLATVALTREARPILPFTNDRAALHEAISRFAPMSEGGCLPQRPSTALRDLTRLLGMSPIPLKAVVHLHSIVGRGTGPRPIPCPLPSYRIPDTGETVTGYLRRPGGPEPDPMDFAKVPVYRLNVSGLIVDTSKIARGNLGTPLGLMEGPNETGGRSYYRTNDLSPAVYDILAENDSYYLVGFRTSRPTLDGKYRRIDVKVARPGDGGDYDVRARAGYRRPHPAPAPGSRADRNPEVARPPAGVSGLLPRSEITLDAAVAAFPLHGRGATVIVTVDLAHAVGDTAMTKPEDLEVRAVVYRSGSPVHDVRTNIRIDPAAGVSWVRASVPLRFEIAPDQYELWVTARDPRTTRIGELMLRFGVPDFAARTIAVSGVVLGPERAEGATPHPALSGLVPILPTTARAFGRGAEIAAYFQIYQGRATPLGTASLRMKILDAEGVARLDLTESLEPARFSSSRIAEYKLRLPLETFSAGRYLLSVEARLDGRIAPSQDVPFQVR